MLLSQYVENRFSPKYNTTIGVDFTDKEIVLDDRQITLQLCDSSGQERFHSLNGALYKSSECCILVFSINNRKSFENINMWKTRFLKYCPSEEFPFVLIGNKNDLEAEREVTSEEAGSWCMQNNCIPYFECSATESGEIEIIFREIAERLVKKKIFEEMNMKGLISVPYSEEIHLVERNEIESSPVGLLDKKVDLIERNDGECSWMRLLDKVFDVMNSGESQYAGLIEEINKCAEEYPSIRELQHVKKFL